MWLFVSCILFHRFSLRKKILMLSPFLQWSGCWAEHKRDSMEWVSHLCLCLLLGGLSEEFENFCCSCSFPFKGVLVLTNLSFSSYCFLSLDLALALLSPITGDVNQIINGSTIQRKYIQTESFMAELPVKLRNEIIKVTHGPILEKIHLSKKCIPSSLRICNTCFTQMAMVGDVNTEGYINNHIDKKIWYQVFWPWERTT